jgi:hypothetical protein
MDRSVNQRKWTARNLSKTTRYLAGELKRRPAFLKGLETRLKVDNNGLLVDNKRVIAVEDAPEIIKKYDLDPRFGGGRDRLYQHLSGEYAGITRRMVSEYVRNSESHQLLRPKPCIVRHRAIITTDIGKKSQVDLIEMDD